MLMEMIEGHSGRARQPAEHLGWGGGALCQVRALLSVYQCGNCDLWKDPSILHILHVHLDSDQSWSSMKSRWFVILHPLRFPWMTSLILPGDGHHYHLVLLWLKYCFFQHDPRPPTRSWSSCCWGAAGASTNIRHCGWPNLNFLKDPTWTVKCSFWTGLLKHLAFSE